MLEYSNARKLERSNIVLENFYCLVALSAILLVRSFAQGLRNRR